jgi:RNA polymerase sigma factor for flagellar operon FliA
LNTKNGLGHIDDHNIWKEYRKSNDQNIRLEIVKKHMDDVKIIVARMYKMRINDTVEYNDYYQFAIVGLLEAIEKYDYKLNDNFIGYAQYRIKGSVLNGIAKMTEKSSQYNTKNKIQCRMQSLYGDEEGKDDLFGELVDLSVYLSIGLMLEHGLEDRLKLTEYSNNEIKDLAEVFDVCIDRLASEEQMVVKYHYFYDVEFVSIAEIMGVSKGRVSQIHKKALQRIRDIYENEMEMDLSI